MGRSKIDEVVQNIDNFVRKMDTIDYFDIESFIGMHHKGQREYILNEVDKQVTLFYGGRRGGKSAGNIGLIIFTDQCMLPQSRGRIIYASATIEKARELSWDKLYNINEEYRFGWTFENKSNRIVTKSNEIVMRGLKDIPSANRDQGHPIKLAIIDEPQTIKEHILKHYVNNVVTWGMADFKGSGRICYTGNPPHYPHRFLKEEYFNPENNVIHVNIFDNPKFTKKEAIDFIDKERKRRGFASKDEEDSHFKRDVYGEWIDPGDDYLIFNVKESNYYKTLPMSDLYSGVMGVDIGHTDCDAIVVLYYSQNDGTIYAELEYKKNKQDITELANEIKVILNHYDDIDFKTIDTGGLGKKITEELRVRHNLDLIAAEKSHKMTYVELLKAHINQGVFKFKKGSMLAQEMKQIIYTDDKQKIDDKKGLHSDLLDATVYAFRYIYNYMLLGKPDSKKTFAEKRKEELFRKMEEENYSEDRGRFQDLGKRY